MESRSVEQFHQGERTEIVKTQDNLTVDGDFAQREKNEWKKGEKSQLVYQNDNLKIEGRIIFIISC